MAKSSKSKTQDDIDAKPKKSRRKSDAWKGLERAVAQEARDVGFAQAYRILRGDDIGISDVDVCIPEVPAAKIDCKYRVDGWAHHTIFKECEKKYCTEKGTFLVLPTKSGGETGSLSTVRTEVLMDLLAHKYLDKSHPADTLGCPRCPGVMGAKEVSLGLSECVCLNCSLTIMMRSEDVPEGSRNGGKVIQLPVQPSPYPLEVESTAVPLERPGENGNYGKGEAPGREENGSAPKRRGRKAKAA